MDKLKAIFCVCIMILLYLILHQLNYIVEEKEDQFSYKDGQVLYNLCKKKTGSQTNFILKTYWDRDTKFKEYLLKN